MTIPNNPDLDALQALVESEGWRIWCEHFDKEWGPAAFAAKVAQAVGDPTMDPKLAVAMLQQATVSLKAVQGLRDMPTNRIAQLKRQLTPPEVNMSRRGPGL